MSEDDEIIERVAAADRMRIAVLADFDGVHARAWLRWFAARGHDVHAISFYQPNATLDGVTVHALRLRRSRGAPDAATARAMGAGGGRVPRSVVRLLHGLRYRRAGLRRVLREIAPDVFHGHFVVEHGFYGALAGFHPYVVTAWGSDILVEPQRDRLSRMIATWTLHHADLITSNNLFMGERIREIASPDEPDAPVEIVTLGADRFFLDAQPHSVNVRPSDVTRPQVVLSTRAHEPLYNIDEIIDAYERVLRARTNVRLVIAHGGSLTPELTRRAAASAGSIEFVGLLDRNALRDAMTAADVFVSVPSSDGTSVALLQAMAAGCFPIVSDLSTQRELVDDGVNGFRVPLHDPSALAERIVRALGDDDLRRRAAAVNGEIVASRGLNEVEMPRLEALYRSLIDRQPSPSRVR